VCALLLIDAPLGVARQDIKEAFGLFDVDETGEISTSDLMVAMRAMGFEPSPAELQKYVVQAQMTIAPHVPDPQAKTVTEAQFTEIMTMKMGETSTYEETCQAFRMFEPTVETSDEGVVLTKKDLQRITNMLGIESEIGAETLQEMIDEADQTGTGVISLPEFVRITNLRSQTEGH
jgi:calcium-binding protein CML